MNDRLVAVCSVGRVTGEAAPIMTECALMFNDTAVHSRLRLRPRGLCGGPMQWSLMLLAFKHKFPCCLTLKARIHGILHWLRLSSTSDRDGLGEKGMVLMAF
jgi:hypothetical protein